MSTNLMEIQRTIEAFNLYIFRQRITTILTSGPWIPVDWLILELFKTLKGDSDATSLTFTSATLVQAFQLTKGVCTRFVDDVCSLIAILPIKEGEIVNRILLKDLLIEAARECEFSWWSATPERSAVLTGIMYACVIQRSTEKHEVDSDLSDLMGSVSLNDEDSAIVAELAGPLDGLKI
jgi:hypothetical protein